MVFDGDTHLYYMKYNTEIQEGFDEIKLGQFLEEIIEGRAQSYGGDSWFQRFRRVRTRICYISFKCKPPECMGWGGDGCGLANGLLKVTAVKARGVLPYIGYTGMCRWKGYGFQAI